MNYSIEYPYSRANIINCPVCNRASGVEPEISLIAIDLGESAPSAVAKVVCNRCGYIQLFDIEKAQAWLGVPVEGEVMPDQNNINDAKKQAQQKLTGQSSLSRNLLKNT